MQGDLIVLGVGGKIGPSLARMARRASDAAGVQRRIIGVARFSQPGCASELEAQGIETDPLRSARPRRSSNALPDVPNVLYLAAMKFGSTGQEADHLGDERLSAGHGLREVPPQPHRRLFDGQRLRR